MDKVFREERKFLLSIEESMRVSHKIEQVMHQDSHNGLHGYLVRSLYFDTVYDSDYSDNLDGIETRRKIRIRCYDLNSNVAYLEMKQKQGSKQLKRSLKISREDAELLIANNYTPLLKYLDPFAAECYALMMCKCYRPKIVVQYNRKAFIAKENKIRITFDSNIVSTESSFDLFDQHLNMNPVLDKYGVVLEVKYNGFLLDYIKSMINCVNKNELSVSKYCLARQNAY